MLDLNHLPFISKGEVGLAVLGSPVRHSISPALHGAALAELAKEDEQYKNWHYHKIEVMSGCLSEALVKLAKQGYRGLNLTIPHKVDALSLVSELDETALAIGAVNTLKLEKSGWKGYNTDGLGLSYAVQEAFGLSFKDFDVLVLGAGGAARAAVAQCIFEECKNIYLLNRTVDRARELVVALGKKLDTTNVFIIEELERDFINHGRRPILLINSTSLGLGLNDPPPIELGRLGPNLFIYDMVYNPPCTRLLTQAKEMGYPFTNGLGMLVGQAAKSLEIWTGRSVSIEQMIGAAEMALSD